MGSVWLADHLALETEVVVKFMHVALGEDPTSRERFSREAVAASRVRSPHVVQTFDHGVTPEGVPFIVMERLDGEDLAKRVERGPLSMKELAHVLTQVCKALSRAHSVGVVHRDIKPDNIFLCDVGTDEPFVKLLDFGIAKTALNPKLDNKTRTGAMMGTPYYMSPEQFAGLREIDFRTDLWSLGIVAFECLTGSRPFDADTIGGLAIAVHSGELPLPSSRRGELAPVDTWFAKACARKAADRHTSAKEFAETFAAAALGASAAAASPAFHITGPTNGPLIATGAGGPQVELPPLSATSPVPVDPSMGPSQATTGSPLMMTTGASSAVESEPTPQLPRTSKGPLYAVAGGVGVLAVAAMALLAHKSPPPPNAAADQAPAKVDVVPPPAAPPVPSAPVQLVALPSAAAVTTLAPPDSPAAPASTPAPHAPIKTTGSPAPVGASPHVAPIPAHAPAAAPAAAPAKAVVSCSPPFTIDAQGVKHPKPECL